MSTDAGRLVTKHYDRGVAASAMLDAIMEELTATGHDLGELTWQALERLDQFHVGGGRTTLAMARRAGIGRGERVLDVGGGVGGPARTLAATLGCHVTVLDLSEAYTEVGRSLTRRMRLSDLVEFRVGNALDIPLSDESVDVAWTQHSTMNIEDKERLYAELHRVVRPGGRLAMHEIVAVEGAEPLHFPVPWAASPEISFVRTAAATRATIVAAGFVERAWEDTTVSSIAWMREMAERAAASNRSSQVQRVLLGPGFAEAFRTIRRNLEEELASVVEGVFRRP